MSAHKDFEQLVTTMINDKHLTKKDLQVAIYLRNRDRMRKDILERFFGNEHDPSGYANRANLTRCLQRLAPYLDITEIDHATFYRLKDRLN